MRYELCVYRVVERRIPGFRALVKVLSNGRDIVELVEDDQLGKVLESLWGEEGAKIVVEIIKNAIARECRDSYGEKNNCLAFGESIVSTFS